MSMPERKMKYPEFEKALDKIPIKWFERDLSIFASFAITAMLGFEAWNRVPDGDRLYFRILAAGVYIAGSILDMHSTAKALGSFDVAKEIGVEHPLNEGNPLFPGRPNIQEVFDHKKHVFDYAFVGAAFLIPYFGLGTGVYRSFLAQSNYRNVDRLNLAIGISEKNKLKKQVGGWGKN